MSAFHALGPADARPPVHPVACLENYGDHGPFTVAVQGHDAQWLRCAACGWVTVVPVTVRDTDDELPF